MKKDLGLDFGGKESGYKGGGDRDVYYAKRLPFYGSKCLLATLYICSLLQVVGKQILAWIIPVTLTHFSKHNVDEN